MGFGIQLRSPCLWDKYFTNSSISPAPLLWTLKKAFKGLCWVLKSWVIKKTQIWSTQDSWWLDSWDDEVTKTKQEEKQMLSSLGYQKVHTSVTQYLTELTILSQTKVFWILIFFLKSWPRSNAFAGDSCCIAGPSTPKWAVWEEASRWPWGSRWTFSFLFTPGLSFLLLLPCPWLV